MSCRRFAKLHVIIRSEKLRRDISTHQKDKEGDQKAKEKYVRGYIPQAK